MTWLDDFGWGEAGAGLRLAALGCALIASTGCEGRQVKFANALNSAADDGDAGASDAGVSSSPDAEVLEPGDESEKPRDGDLPFDAKDGDEPGKSEDERDAGAPSGEGDTGLNGVCETRRPHSFCGPGEQCNADGECVFTGQGLVSAGAYHTCAITSQARVRCWGDNTGGMLGYGHTASIGDDETPREAAASGLGGDLDFGFDERAFQVSVGSSYACALFESGRVRCWSATGEGVVGQGRDRIGTLDVTPNAAGLLVPSGIGDVDLGGRRAVRIDTGESVACAVLETGEMGCWGSGFVGNGTFDTVIERPGANVLLAGRVALRAALGTAHRCVLLSDGNVNCWGSSYEGNVGYGNGLVELYTSPPPNQRVELPGSALHMAGGYFHTCATIEGGSLTCWGHNEFGQLGYPHRDIIGDDESPASAGNVNVGAPVVQVEAGKTEPFTCALLQTGSVRCWGFNELGQLGYGNAGQLPVGSPSQFGGDLALSGTAIALGDGARCAVMSDRSLRCWGRNSRGEVGAGDLALLSQGDVVGLRPLTVDLE